LGTIPTYAAFVAGAELTAAQLNAMRDVDNFWSNPPKCYAYMTAVQSIPNAAYTSVNLTSELYDVVQAGDSPSHDNATNPTRIYARTTGVYTVGGAVSFAANATGVRSARVIKNGSTATEYLFNTAQAISGNNTSVVLPPVDIPLVAGDYVELQAYQNSGAALNTNPAQANVFLRIRLSSS
jgi:hypothetical protein